MTEPTQTEMWEDKKEDDLLGNTQPDLPFPPPTPEPKEEDEKKKDEL